MNSRPVKWSYDTRCLDLADVFLDDSPQPRPSDHEERRHRLAQEIQNTIENWLAANPADIDEITRVLG